MSEDTKLIINLIAQDRLREWFSKRGETSDLILKNISLLKPGSIVLRSAMQSMNEETLSAIHRNNIKLSTYLDFMNMYKQKNIDTNADIMLGLPLETKSTHIQGLLNLVDKGIDEFAMLQTILLKGTPMESEQ